jgi:hypothetical protein
MPEVVYRSEVRIERVKGPVRRAYLPGGIAAGDIWGSRPSRRAL